MTFFPRPEGSTPGEAGPVLGIVIPTLNESDLLPLLLEDLAALPVPHEVVVADGGSMDGTVAAAGESGVRVIRAPRGRARQMNEGARALDTPWLLFLHADCRVPSRTREALVRWLADPPPEEAACFAFRLEEPGRFWRAIERGQRVRERLTGLAYGDQGLVLSRRRFEAMGGVPDLPLMEDVEMVRHLRRNGGLGRIDEPLVTSARRYVDEGPLRAWLRNASLITLYALGAPPRRLAPWYRPRTRDPARPAPVPERSGSAPPRDVVLVFARAPIPGSVKTRLARDVGDRRAAEIYRDLGRRVVDQLRAGPWRTVVCFDPPEQEARVRAWLGDDRLRFRPQSGGDLGTRMDQAFRSAFQEGADRVCIVGTDAPGVDEARVAEAFRALARPDPAHAVFGPALDGGYYLLALGRPQPELFREIPWSGEDVLARSLKRAAEVRLRVRTLAPLGDVDRVADLPLLGG